MDDEELATVMNIWLTCPVSDTRSRWRSGTVRAGTGERASRANDIQLSAA
jgi:hypothetical protein